MIFKQSLILFIDNNVCLAVVHPGNMCNARPGTVRGSRLALQRTSEEVRMKSANGHWEQTTNIPVMTDNIQLVIVVQSTKPKRL